MYSISSLTQSQIKYPRLIDVVKISLNYVLRSQLLPLVNWIISQDVNPTGYNVNQNVLLTIEITTCTMSLKCSYLSF